MDDWIQIFRTGSHTDSNGIEKRYGTDDLDRIVSSYNPQEHEAPVVIGHPEIDSPAYGWVETLKREGEVLLAKLKQVVPEFKEWVKQGLFKKRSVALYPDGTLRHLGFLGAVPPAVKGLADVRFQERAKSIICFSDIEWKGVVEMSDSVKRDPGKEIEKRIKEVLRDPRSHVDRYGKRFSEDVTYGQAFSYVCKEDPALAAEYADSLHPRMTPEQEKSMAAGKKLSAKVEAKMKEDKTLTYSEALSQVSKENRELVLEYLGR